MEITKDIIEGLIVTALEGGSNYWYLLHGEDLPRMPGEPLSTVLTDKLFGVPDFSFPVYDTEEPNELLGHCSLQSIKKAFAIANEKYPWHYNAFENEEFDADNADAIFQLSVMGEIVFG